MTKKKPTHHDNPPKIQDHTHQTPASMDVPSEKLENLKSLNSMLLKEAVERYQQVESLVHSNDSLESALTRSEMENHELQAELTRLNDRTTQLHLERDLVFVFVAVQVVHQAEVVKRERVQIENRLETLEKEIEEVTRDKSEIEKVSSVNESQIRVLKKELNELYVDIENERDGSIVVPRESDALRTELDVQIEETNGLRLKLIEAEKRGQTHEEEVQKLNNAFKNREIKVQDMKREVEVLQNSVAEARKGNSFLTVVFSATAILAVAVAYVAYVCRGR